MRKIKALVLITTLLLSLLGSGVAAFADTGAPAAPPPPLDPTAADASVSWE